MSGMKGVGAACIVVLIGATTAAAQSKLIPGERRTVTATVEKVDAAGRHVTIRDDAGDVRTIEAPEQAKRLAEIKPGDTIRATYYDNIVLRVKPAGEADVDTHASSETAATGARPGATSATQQTITATIDAIDMKAPSISLKGPRGWAYQTKVQDKKALEQVKVGDRVDISWTEATLVSMAPAKAAATPARK
jgi:hypothetical protein